MKCSICGKKGVRITHFPKVHGSVLAKRSAAARARGKSSGKTTKKGRSRSSAQATSSITEALDEWIRTGKKVTITLGE